MEGVPGEGPYPTTIGCTIVDGFSPCHKFGGWGLALGRETVVVAPEQFLRFVQPVFSARGVVAVLVDHGA